MAEWNFRSINCGDTVYGSDNREIGVVEYREEEYCKVDTTALGLVQDCYVPSSAIASVRPGELFLNVSSIEIGRMGWDLPPKQAAGGVRRQVVKGPEEESRELSPEEEIGISEPM